MRIQQFDNLKCCLFTSKPTELITEKLVQYKHQFVFFFLSSPNWSDRVRPDQTNH